MPTLTNYPSGTCVFFLQYVSIPWKAHVILETRLPVFLNCTRPVFLYVASVYCVVIEFICDNKKENWEPGDEAKRTSVGS